MEDMFGVELLMFIQLCVIIVDDSMDATHAAHLAIFITYIGGE